jgi:hypothetical protein
MPHHTDRQRARRLGIELRRGSVQLEATMVRRLAAKAARAGRENSARPADEGDAGVGTNHSQVSAIFAETSATVGTVEGRRVHGAS